MRDIHLDSNIEDNSAYTYIKLRNLIPTSHPVAENYSLNNTFNHKFSASSFCSFYRYIITSGCYSLLSDVCNFFKRCISMTNEVFNFNNR